MVREDKAGERKVRGARDGREKRMVKDEEEEGETNNDDNDDGEDLTCQQLFYCCLFTRFFYLFSS